MTLPRRARRLSNLAGLLLLFISLPASAANHPPVTGANANCASCHADMLQGVSVHSQGEIQCDLCHTAAPDGKRVRMSLTLPKEQLCFACHERTAMQQHWPVPKRECVDCHDAHRSARAMLLRRDVDVAYIPPPSASEKNQFAGDHTAKIVHPAHSSKTSHPGIRDGGGH